MAVFDVPHTVVEELNGVMVVEWGCHDRHFGTKSWPPELAVELTDRHGRHFGSMKPPDFDQFAPCDYAHRVGSRRTDEETILFFDAVHGGVELKRNASLELLDRGGWDFFLTVLGETHCVGHQFWHLHDPAHPGYDPALAQRFGGDPIRTVYSRIDAALGDHLARLGPEDTAYVLMPHGMTAHHDGAHLLDQVLLPPRLLARRSQLLRPRHACSRRGRALDPASTARADAAGRGAAAARPRRRPRGRRSAPA